MTMAIVAVGVAAVSAGVGIYSAVQQGNIAGQQLALGNSINDRQAYSFNQLQGLINNPSSFLDNPLYQAAFGQGTTAVARSNAAGGFLNSGNAAIELQQYGQGFANSQVLQQEQLLAGLSGAGNASSPSQAYGGASSANNAAFGQYGGVLASLGYQAANSGGGYNPPPTAGLGG